LQKGIYTCIESETNNVQIAKQSIQGTCSVSESWGGCGYGISSTRAPLADGPVVD
jgi:hypothetical protein